MPANKKTLELIFSLFIGLVVLLALIQALTYDFVSARAPLVILVPLLILSVIQIRRAWVGARETGIRSDLSNTLRLQNPNFNKVTGFMLWMFVLLILIFVTGHYVGIAAFMFVLLYMVSGEKLSLAIPVPLGVTLVIYVLFEHIFNIPLYRGMIYRIWAGYGIF